MTVMNQPISVKPQKKLSSVMEEFNQAQELCMKLLKTKHYQKMGSEGVFAITQKALSKGVNPIEALNGGMYFVQGKVEMSAILMASLIRDRGHSITLGKESNETLCVLHGKRKDNGDTWKVSFSIEDAKRAGIYKQGGPWTKYPDIMCYNRALSKLARQLFPDVIGNCYVEGEIRDATPLFDDNQEEDNQELEIQHPGEDAASETLEILQQEIAELPEVRQENFMIYLRSRFDVETLEELTEEQAQTILQKLRDVKAKEEALEEEETEIA